MILLRGGKEGRGILKGGMRRRVDGTEGKQGVRNTFTGGGGNEGKRFKGENKRRKKHV